MLSHKKGIAMLLVIGLVLMLFILGGGVVMLASSHYRTSRYRVERARAYYAAEAGLQHGLWKCRIGDYDLTSGDSETITVPSIKLSGEPDYSFDVDITVYAEGEGGAPPRTHRIDATISDF